MDGWLGFNGIEIRSCIEISANDIKVDTTLPVTHTTESAKTSVKR